MADGTGIFVSHSHEDEAFCRKLIADLRSYLGEDAVWYDASGGLHGSDDWWDRIVAEITERPNFLVVLSPHAAASRWVPEEMRIAFRQRVELGKRLLPVRLAPAPRREDWKGIQEFDFQEYQDSAKYAATLAEVLQVLGVAPSAHGSGPIAPAAASSNVASLMHPLSAIERLAQETHTAYGREHWSDVLDKTEVLMEREAMTPLLWRERATAAFAVGNASAGQTAVDKGLQADPDNVQMLVLKARSAVKAGDDAKAIVTFTRAYSLTPLDEVPTRLDILDDLIGALVRTRSWEEFTGRISDARRLAPNDRRWLLRSVEELCVAGRFEDAITAVKSLPQGVDMTPVLPVWKGAIAATVRGENWPARKELLTVALAAGADPSLVARWRLLDYPHFIKVVTFSVNSDAVNGVAWSPDGSRLAIASNDQTAKVWDVHTRRLLTTLSGHSGYVNGLAWSPDGTRLATSSADQTAKVWDAASGQLQFTLSSHKDWVRAVAWSPDGSRLATASDDKTAKVWAVARRRLLTTLSGHSLAVMGVAWLPDGTRLATASHDRTAKVWDTASGQVQFTLSGHSGYVWGVTWSPDGTRLATSSTDQTAKVWDAASGRLLLTLVGHSSDVRGVTWSSDSTRLATGSADKTAMVWEAATGRHLVTLIQLFGSVNGVAWSPDGIQLATGVNDRTVTIWAQE